MQIYINVNELCMYFLYVAIQSTGMRVIVICEK